MGAVLIAKPNQGSSFAELAPSLVMNAGRPARHELIQPGSRRELRGLFAGERVMWRPSRAWLVAHKRAGERLRDITEASPQVRNAVDRPGGS